MTNRESECKEAIRAYADRAPHLGEYHRAQEEAQISSLYWRTVPIGGKKASGQEKWVRDAFDSVDRPLARAAAERQRIHSTLESAGGAHRALALWNRLDKDLTRMTALHIIRDARALMAETAMPLEAALEEALAVYDSRPVERYVRGGKAVRTGKPKRTAAPPPRAEPPRMDPPSDPPSEAAEAPPPGPVEDPSVFLARIRALVLQYAALQAPRLQESDRARLVDELHVDLNETLKHFRSRVKSANAHAGDALTTPFSRAAMVQACVQLSMPTPKVGEPVDMIRARRLFRQQARDHHPDRTDDPQRHDLYRKLSKACETLAHYNDSLRK